jgi:hypothetical protein
LYRRGLGLFTRGAALINDTEYGEETRQAASVQAAALHSGLFH